MTSAATPRKPREKSPFVRVSVRIERSQAEWLKTRNYDLSALTRAYLKEFISTMDKVKEGVLVPAWVKVASDETFQERARQNPKIRYLVGEERS